MAQQGGPVLQPKWPKEPASLSPQIAETKRLGEERYILEGYAVPHADACKGIPAELFRKMYADQFSQRVLTGMEYAEARSLLTRALKDGGHVLPSEEKTSDGMTGDDLGLHPNSIARKHLSAFSSEGFRRVHRDFLDFSNKIQKPYGVCVHQDTDGRVVGIRLPMGVYDAPAFDAQARKITPFCYISLYEPLAHIHKPLKTEDMYMCLDGGQWKWCYPPSGKGDSTKYLVGSFRYLKDPVTESHGVDYIDADCTLGNLYGTSMESFHTVNLGRALEYLDILKKGYAKAGYVKQHLLTGILELKYISDQTVPAIERRMTGLMDRAVKQAGE